MRARAPAGVTPVHGRYPSRAVVVSAVFAGVVAVSGCSTDGDTPPEGTGGTTGGAGVAADTGGRVPSSGGSQGAGSASADGGTAGSAAGGADSSSGTGAAGGRSASDSGARADGQAPPAGDAGGAPDGGSGHSLVVGLSTAQHSGTFDAAGQQFTEELGAHSLRIGYNHGDHEFGVEWAAERGMSVMFFLGYGVGVDVKTAEGRQAYADRSARLAAAFGSKVKYYEVWNEWNGGFGLGCGWGQASTPCTDAPMYTDLLCRTYAAIKVVRPAAVVVGGATAGVDLTFIGKMLDAGAGDCMDMVSVHPYVFTETRFSVPYTATAADGAAKFAEAMTATHDLILQRTGKDMPVAVTEDGRSDKLDAANRQRTAEYLTAVYGRARDIPFVEGIWWYQLEDVPNDAKGYGLLTSANAKKPAFAAFQAAAAAR